jgi:hypothetical protein
VHGLYNRIRLPRPDRIPRRDTGGAPVPLVAPEGWYRPRQKQQNPDVDPHEPASGESSSAGYDHGWSNCTMASGAMCLDFHLLGALDLWGGDLRHAPGQPDQSGGTDLWDVEKAWAYYAADLEIRSGAGWAAARADHDQGRALLLTGEGNVPGSATFDGAHAICVLPEVHSDGRWLMADPLCTGPEWVSESALRAWAERLQASINWARTAAHPPASSPERGDDLPINAAAGLTSNVRADIPAATEWFKDPNLTLYGGVFSNAATVVLIGNPIGETVPGGSRAIQINTGNLYSDGSTRPSVVYIAADVDTFTVTTDTGDVEEALAQRDIEWREWMLDGSPGEP